MNLKNWMLASALILGCLGSNVVAEQLVHLKGGRFFHGTVVESNEKSVKIQRKTEAGEDETITVPAADCDKFFFYSVRDKGAGKDAAARIQLAKWCVDQEMFSRAKAQMAQARAIDPKLVQDFMTNEYPKMREGLAKKLLAACEREVRRGNMKNARKYAAIILTKFEDTKAAKDAEGMLDKITEQSAQEKEKRRARRRKPEAPDTTDTSKAKVKEMSPEERANQLAPVERLLDEGAALNVRGLKAKSPSKANKSFEQAAAKYKRAASAAEQGKLDDAATNKALDEMHAAAIQGGVRSYLNIAHTMAARGSHPQAMEYCNKALLLDPNNAEARAARAQISTAGSGWNRRNNRR